MKPKKKMSMYNKGGFNPLPDTSYQSSASKSARAKSANKARQIKEANEQAVRGDMKAQQAARLAIEEFGKGDRAGRGGKMDELYDKMMKRKAVAERAKKKSKALSNKDLSEFKEYKGGGKMYGKRGMKVKKYQEGGMNATGETGKNKNEEELVLGMTPRERRIFAKLSPYQQKQLLKRREEKAQREDVRETGTSNVYGIHSKVGRTGYPVIGARNSETGQRQEFKEGFVRVGYESSDARKNRSLGILPENIGKGSSK